MAVSPSLLAALRWRGKAGEMSRALRNSIFIGALISCVFTLSTQIACMEWGNVHVIGALLPVVLTALMLGPLAGGVSGAITGLLMLLHALFIPQNTYETFFSTPWTSIVPFALVGWVCGVLFAILNIREAAQPQPPSKLRHVLSLCACCFVASLLFALPFAAGTRLLLLTVTQDFKMADAMYRTVVDVVTMTLHIVANGVLLSVSVVGGELWFNMRNKAPSEYTLAKQFRICLIVLMVMAYMVASSLGYAMISIQGMQEAGETMTVAVQSLEHQLAEQDTLLGDMMDEAEVGQSKVEKLHDRSIADVAQNVDAGDDAFVMVAQDGQIVSCTDSDLVGRDYQNVWHERFAGDNSLKRFSWVTVFDGNSTSGMLSYAHADEVPYERGERQGSYRCMVVVPVSQVFHYRTLTMRALMVLFVLLFWAVFLLITMLMRNLVLVGFSRTNESLERITQGDLDEVVDADSSKEFVQLSRGINHTVASLRESMERIRAGIDRELHTARAIQESALPQTFPPYPNIGAFDIHAHMEPAREVGGDFYDFFLIDDHTLALLIADVSGKGVPAALFMMQAKSEIAGYLRAGVSVTDAIESANANLCKGNDTGTFVTVWAATLDFSTGRLTYVNAGHNPPLLRRNDSWEWLRQRSGIFLGAMEEARYPSFTVHMRKKDELLLYTDGITEACNSTYEEYGEQQLETLVEGLGNLRPNELTQAVNASVAAWAGDMEQSDDITLLALEFGVGPTTRYAQTFVATQDNVGRVQDYVCAELDKRLCPVSAKNQVCVAIEELFVNVCRYAYANQEEPGPVRLSYAYTMNPSTITVEIRDEGVAFDPLSRADSLEPDSIEYLQTNGLGIPMVRKCVDTILYERDGNQNVVTISKSW